MKRIFSSAQYLKWKASSALKASKAKSYRLKRQIQYKKGLNQNIKWENYEPIEAPTDFRLIENPSPCLEFFKKIRSRKNHYWHEKHTFVGLDLKKVTQIDYTSVSVLKALLMDFKPQRIYVQGSSPDNQECFQYLKNSGFYDGLMSLNNKIYHEKGNADRMVFTKGSGRLSDEEDLAVSNLLKKIRFHLTKENGHCPQLKTIILELCGNSIEHSESFKKQWNFGIKYENDKVIITFIDTGKGILRTLYRRLGRQFADFVSKSHIEVLQGAFDKKYESKTLDQNRNKGLPVIKLRFKEGFINNLIVITNDVLLNFAEYEKSSVFNPGKGFDGTIFKLELNKSCFRCN